MDQRFAVSGVDGFTPLAEAAPALLMAKAEPLFALEGAAASGADMDAVHDMRVASRRLRETMRLLEPLYPQREFTDWYKRVRRITRALGPVRDADVFIDSFAGFGKSLGQGGRRAVAFLVGRRMGTREHELVILNRELSHLDLAENRRTLRKLSRSIRGSAEGKRPLSAFAHASVAERAGVVLGALPAALPEENTLQQHALRIDFKRLRYAVEVFAPVYADDFEAIHPTLTAFQDTLGDLHDLHLFLDQLAEPELGALASRAGVSAGDLGEVSTLLEERARATYEVFVTAAAEHPASELLPALLLPLSRVPEAPAPARAAQQADAPIVTAASEIAAEPAAAAPAAPAVVLEAPAVVSASGMPAIDPTAQPWRSDAAGLSIDPPVVIGAQPWARAQLESADAAATPLPGPDAAPQDEPEPALPAAEELP